MHVTLCTDGVFPQAMGGMQRHSRLLAEELAKRPGLELTVIHPHGVPIFDPGLGINEVFVDPIDTDAFYLRQLWKYSDRVAQKLDTLRHDAIISQGFSVWKNIERFSGKLIVHPHGLEMFQGMGVKEKLIGLPFRWSLRGIMRRSAITISLGGRLTSLLEQQVRGSRTKIVEIPNAVHVPAEITPYPSSDRPLKLLFVGRFAFNKGIDVLMSVAQRLENTVKADQVRFLLAGDGPLLDHYRSKGLPSNIELLGRVEDEELFNLYGECHALILPTRFEGMPTVVLEAMARCRPILVSDVGATAQLVDASNGYLLPKGDARALFKAIVDLLARDRQERLSMGMTSYERARDRYNWPVVAERFIDLAREISA